MVCFLPSLSSCCGRITPVTDNMMTVLYESVYNRSVQLATESCYDALSDADIAKELGKQFVNAYKNVLMSVCIIVCILLVYSLLLYSTFVMPIWLVDYLMTITSQ